MKILYINSMINGSTGNIMKKLAHMAMHRGAEVRIACPEFDGKVKDKSNTIIISNKLDLIVHHCLGRLTGFNDCFSHISTFFFLRKVDKYNPDLIHIHNLHNCYINLNMLFHYIKKKGIAVIWTLHDCWAFTGQCAYFDMCNCYKWMDQCRECVQIHRYPKTYIDNTERLYRKKRKWFTGIENLHLVTPSFWLKGLIQKSFLKAYPVSVIHNGIDVDIFRRTGGFMRKEYALEDKYVILGIAYRWDKRKGWDIFVELSKILNHEIFQIVIVGADSEQKKELNQNVICFDRTNDKYKLADIYSSADVFLNPTREENFCLVNIEALACGTPVITFDTGGCSEIISSNCGIVVKNKTTEGILDAIEQLRKNPCQSEICRTWAEGYSEQDRFKEYMELYENVLMKERQTGDSSRVK